MGPGEEHQARGVSSLSRIGGTPMNACTVHTHTGRNDPLTHTNLARCVHTNALSSSSGVWGLSPPCKRAATMCGRRVLGKSPHRPTRLLIAGFECRRAISFLLLHHIYL